jgi:large subunit ribosomal protein L6e
MARNPFLIKAVELRTRKQNYSSRKRYLLRGRKWKDVPKKVEEKKKPLVKDFQGGKRTITKHKAKKYYSEIPVPRRLPSRKGHKKPCGLRESITPGTVLILLAGRYRGRRVVFLKQLSSGLLLINGPFRINGVPLRRVNQRYVIATNTKVQFPKDFKLDPKFNDSYFYKKKGAKKNKKKTATDFFKKKDEDKTKEKKNIPVERIQDQKLVDKAIMKGVRRQTHLNHYLAARFSLAAGLWGGGLFVCEVVFVFVFVGVFFFFFFFYLFLFFFSKQFFFVMRSFFGAFFFGFCDIFFFFWF